MLKRLLQTFGLIVEVGNDHDDATARQYLRELMKRLGEMRFTACLEQREIAEDRAHVASAIARGNVRVDLVCKRDETDGVLLAVQKISQRRRKKLRVLQLCD